MSQILPPGGRSWAQDKSSRLLGKKFLENSTDLSVSGDEEGHSTILLTHDIFLVLIGVRVI